MKKKIIISMRDYGAATHLIELVKYLTEEDRFDITVVAQKPASNLLKLNNINHINIELDASENKDSILSKKIIKKAYEIVKVIKPRFIICGLSTPFDGGIDEAFYFISNKIPCFVYQDQWGESNSFFGKSADYYFVLDNLAKRINKKLRPNSKNIIIGPLKYKKLEKINLLDERKKKRTFNNFDNAKKIITFFGQYLHDIDGYQQTVEYFLNQIKNIKYPYIFLYIPHPKEKEKDKIFIKKLIKKNQIFSKFIRFDNIEDTIVISDLVFSVFSTCNYDSAYINYYSKKPLCSIYSLLYDKRMVNYFNSYLVDIKNLPIHKHKVVMPVYLKSKIKEILLNKINKKKEFWINAKNHLSDPENASELISENLIKLLK